MIIIGLKSFLGQAIPYGLVVRIPAFHAGGPGSIPGVGALYFDQSDIGRASVLRR